jgi:hypothetical protein
MPMIDISYFGCFYFLVVSIQLILQTESVMFLNSECPQEALEAVSTLIFAAARFPDLPELCDLRHIFTEKYGSSVEPFVNSEVLKCFYFSYI